MANTLVYKDPGGAKLTVASGGEIDVESGGSLKIAGTAVTSSAAELNKLTGVTATTAEINEVAGNEVVLTKYTRVTAAQVNSGLTLLAATAGRTYRVVGFIITAIGGAAGGLTALTLADTNTSPVSITSIAAAALTENTPVLPASANVTNGVGLGGPLTAAKGVSVGKTGNALTTATHVDVTLLYTIV
jgi:hypothetical protein